VQLFTALGTERRAARFERLRTQDAQDESRLGSPPAARVELTPHVTEPFQFDDGLRQQRFLLRKRLAQHVGSGIRFEHAEQVEQMPRRGRGRRRRPFRAVRRRPPRRRNPTSGPLIPRSQASTSPSAPGISTPRCAPTTSSMGRSFSCTRASQRQELGLCRPPVGDQEHDPTTTQIARFPTRSVHRPTRRAGVR
jgi:hypothetical protein